MSTAFPTTLVTNESQPARRGTGLGPLVRMVWADVLDRTRRPGYLVSLLIMLWLGQHMLPPNGASYRTFTLDDVYRPVYNSAWVGTVTAMLTGVWFLFIGFYLVKGSVERDRRTGVGQVLAATRVSTLTYLWARTLGNLAVFGSQAFMVVVAALIQQQLLGEDRRVDVLATLAPFATLTFPLALFAAASAVLFDCVRFLRGGLGNIAWFFVLPLVMAAGRVDDPGGSMWADLTGARVVVEDVRREMLSQHPDAAVRPQEISMGVNFNPRFRDRGAVTFEWRGVQPDARVMASRVPWLLLPAAIVFAAALLFDRFDATARSGVRTPAQPRWPFAPRVRAPAAANSVSISASRLTVARRGPAFVGVVRAELALLLKGMSPWWYIGMLGFLIAELAVPLDGVKRIVLPLASFWPALMWSALGHREREQGVAGVLFSCPRPVQQLLPAAWLAGAIVMLLAGAPALVRLVVAGDSAALLGWLLCAAIVPALALASGVWTGSAKAFEVLYLFAWYVGPMHQLAEVDYTGVTAPRSATLWVVYGALALALFALAVWGRSREARR